MKNSTLGMESLLNARQVGGYVTQDGKTIKRDVLLRSAKLIDASKTDIQRLRQVYDLRTVIDFRTSGEISLGPNPLIEGVEQVHVRVLDEDSKKGSIARSIPGASLNIDATIQGMLRLIRGGFVTGELYIEQLVSDIGQEGYRQFFDVLLAHEEGGVLWHCTSGKDRTGLASVLLLSVLGMDEQTILDDFMLTNQFNARNVEYITSNARRFTDDPAELEAVLALAGVSRKYMENVFTFAQENYGSVVGYLQTELHLTDEEIQILKDKYLE